METTKEKSQNAEETKEFFMREEEFFQKHKSDTDEELLSYLKSIAVKTGHAPSKHEVIGFAYIKSRLGPWPRVLEKAGLKEAKPKIKRRNKDKKKKHADNIKSLTRIQSMYKLNK